MSKNIVVLFFSCVIFLLSCNTTEPPPPPPDEKPTLTLTLEDASSIEAWVTLKTTNLQLPTTIKFKQNDIITQDIILSYADTVIYIDSLLPNQQYIFQAAIQSSSHTEEVVSNELSVTTMDTTSHNFTWQSWTFGEHSSSVLFDIAIIDENNIWVVGEIFLNDSLGQSDPIAYNAIHWDGQEWELKRIPFTGSCSAVIYPPIRAIFAFSESNIWYARGGSLVHFDGDDYFNDCGMNSFLTGSINKIWGTSSSNLYIVGNNGNIAWYNGSVWTKIESGTNIDLLDVWGSPDGSVIWSCGYNQDYANTVLLKSENGNWSNIFEGSPFTINNNNNVGLLGSCWTNNNLNTHLVNSEAVLRQRSSAELFLEKITDDLSDLTFSIRGNANNDIIVVGQDGLVGHFNGITLLEFEELKINDDNYYAVSINGNSVATAGFRYNNSFFSQALISIGRR